MSYRCTICDGSFTEIPEDALEITGGRGYRSRHPALFRFSDGTVHALRKVPVKKQQPQEPSPEPKENSELLLEANVLAELPTPPAQPVPQPEPKTEPLPPIEPDIEETSISAMRLAWQQRSSK